jgi:hypothetical protein
MLLIFFKILLDIGVSEKEITLTIPFSRMQFGRALQGLEQDIVLDQSLGLLWETF